jgi:hypothetical protein
MLSGRHVRPKIWHPGVIASIIFIGSTSIWILSTILASGSGPTPSTRDRFFMLLASLGMSALVAGASRYFFRKEKRLLESGETCEGTVVDIWKSTFPGKSATVKLKVRFNFLGKEYEEWTRNLGTWFWWRHPKVGQTVKVYFDPNNPPVFTVYETCPYSIAI